MQKLQLKIDQVIYGREKHSRAKGIASWVEFHVVGETSRSWLISRHLGWSLDRAEKIPKTAKLSEYGYVLTMEEAERQVWAGANQYKIGNEIKEFCYGASYEELKEIEEFMIQMDMRRKL